MNSKNKDLKKELGQFLEGMKDLSSNNQLVYRPFQDLYNSLNNPQKLEEKIKVLMNVAIATYCQDERIALYFVREAYKLGATEEEIMEAALVAVINGGLPALGFCVTHIKDAIEALKEQ